MEKLIVQRQCWPTLKTPIQVLGIFEIKMGCSIWLLLVQQWKKIKFGVNCCLKVAWNTERAQIWPSLKAINVTSRLNPTEMFWFHFTSHRFISINGRRWFFHGNQFNRPQRLLILGIQLMIGFKHWVARGRPPMAAIQFFVSLRLKHK